MIENDINLPLPILRAMETNEYSAGKADFTPSSLAYGAKEYWGRIKAQQEHKEGSIKASRLWASFTGTLMHKGLEHLLELYNKTLDKPVYRTELHMEADFNTVAKYAKLSESKIVGGTIDLVEIDDLVIIWDYKTMSTTQLVLDDKIEEWTLKGNIYRWLLIVTGVVPKVNKLIYIPIFKDWTATKAGRSRDVSDIPCPAVELELWSREKIEQSIASNIEDKLKYANIAYQDIPYCSPKERWEKPCQWKVYKVKNGKKADRALPGCTYPQHEEHLAKEMLIQRVQKEKEAGISYTYEKVGGEAKKCQNWCPVRQWGICDFDKVNNNQETEEDQE